MLISALGITANEMPYVYEQDKSSKIGFYVPGTRIEIRKDSMNPLNENSPLIIWPWHIENEIIEYLRKSKIKGPVYVVLPKFLKVAELE